MLSNLYRRNVGRVDRSIRIAGGSALLVFGLLPAGAEYAGALIVGGLAGLISGITGRCPLYVPFGISTSCGDGPEQSPACGPTTPGVVQSDQPEKP